MARHLAAPAAPALARSASTPAPDQSSGSELFSPLPLQTGLRPQQSHLHDPRPAAIRPPRFEFPAAQTRARSPAAFRPSLQSCPGTPPPAFQSHWSATRCNTIPPADRWFGLRLTHKQSPRSEEHTSELQSPCNLVCRLLLEN